VKTLASVKILYSVRPDFASLSCLCHLFLIVPSWPPFSFTPIANAFDLFLFLAPNCRFDAQIAEVAIRKIFTLAFFFGVLPLIFLPTKQTVPSFCFHLSSRTSAPFFFQSPPSLV